MGKKKGTLAMGIRKKLKARGKWSTNINAHSRQRGIEYHSVEPVDNNGPHLRSIVDKNDFGELLDRALLTQQTFRSERGQAEVVVILDKDEVLAQQTEIYDYENVPIPRRPEWDKSMSPSALNKSEAEAFMNWRRNLSLTAESSLLTITPYEKNLEVWRQLWRVIERSDVVVQIVDARNPLLFRSSDLEAYVKELSKDKSNFLVINKADLLPETMRTFWADYFNFLGIHFVFFSAFLEQIAQDMFSKAKREQRFKDLQRELREDEENESSSDGRNESSGDGSDEEGQNFSDDEERGMGDNLMERVEVRDQEEVKHSDVHAPEKSEVHTSIDDSKDIAPNGIELDDGDSVDGTGSNASDILCTSRLANISELLECFKRVSDISDRQIVVGMVGYPNVGKSSLINVICGEKKVAVAGTPGKTKHFQSLNISDEIQVVDCPGLVFPTYLNSRAELACNGILPIDRLKDVVEPCRVVCSRVKINQFYSRYGGIIFEDIKGDRVGPHTLLQSLAILKSSFSHGGVPNESRAGRIVLKDFVKGNLAYCHPPPDLNEDERKEFLESLLCDAMMPTDEAAHQSDDDLTIDSPKRDKLYDPRLGNSKRKHKKKMRKEQKQANRETRATIRQSKFVARKEFYGSQ